MIKKFENFKFEEDWEEEDKSLPEIIYNEEFTQFLVDNDAYDKFIYNIKEQRNLKNIQEINNFIKNTLNYLPENEIVDFSFSWFNAKERVFFWYKLHNKWQEICSNKNESFQFEEDWEEEDKSALLEIIYNKKFTQFLVDYDIYDKFVYNIKEQRNLNTIQDINDYIEKQLKNWKLWQIIDFSFLWKETDEGFDFWKSINFNWLYQCLT